MPRSCGPNSPYGCGHHTEHVEAARKGWITRRRGADVVERSDAPWFRVLFPGAKHIHTDPSHPKSVMFRQDGRWYELPVSDYKDMAAEGREYHRETQKATRDERKAARYRRGMEQALFREQYEGYHATMRKLRRLGIKPPEKTHYNYRTGKYYGDEEEELYDAFPRSSGIVRKNGRLTVHKAMEIATEETGFDRVWLNRRDRPDDTDSGDLMDARDFFAWITAMREGKEGHQAKRYEEAHAARIERQQEQAERARRAGKSA